MKLKLPRWVIRGYRQLLYVSDWVDDKLFVVPPGYDERALKQLKVEEEANYLWKVLDSCKKEKGVKKLRNLNAVQKMILDFQMRHENTVQVRCTVNSLRASLMQMYKGGVAQM